jgi:hypothetical protein
MATARAGVYDAPGEPAPATGAYRIAVVDGCVGVGSSMTWRGPGRLERRVSDGASCPSGWTVTFDLGSTIRATASRFACGRGPRSLPAVTLERVAAFRGAPIDLLGHSDVEVALAALEKLLGNQRDPRVAAALDRAIRRGAGKARPEHREVARRTIQRVRGERFADALIAAAPSWPAEVGPALVRLIRGPAHAAALIERIVAGTAPVDGARIRPLARTLDAALDRRHRRALTGRLLARARGDTPGPALIALDEISADRLELTRLALAGAASASRCQRALDYLGVVRPASVHGIPADLATALFAKILDPDRCPRARRLAAELLGKSTRASSAHDALIELARQLSARDADPDVRAALSR